MRDEDSLVHRDDTRSWWQDMLLPVLVLIVIVGVISALVLTGIVQGDESRRAPADAPTTLPTVEVVP